MADTRQKPAYILSILIAVLAAAASLGGLLLDGLYHDNAFVRATWLGNDAVTLFLAVPILAAALLFSSRGSLRAQLVWLGVLDYLLYNYAFYLFGAAFNSFFLVYAALFGLSIFALILGLSSLDTALIRSRFSARTPVKWIGAYFLFVACGLTAVYLSQSIGYNLTGQLPSIVTLSGHPTNVVFALDLTLLVPWLVVGGLWLMKRRPWGYVIAGILSVKGPLYTLILSVNSVIVARAGLGGSSELPLWGALTLLGSGACFFLYKNMNDHSIDMRTL